MRIPAHRSFLLLPLFALLGAPALAQEEDESQAWRGKLDRLVSRWSTDMGSSRLFRAHAILSKRLRTHPDDGEALLEIARVKLALPPLRLRDRHRAARETAKNFKAARDRADQAAKRLQLKERTGKKNVVVEKGGARYHTALAVAYLASQYFFREELRRRELIPNNPSSKKLIVKQALALRKRHQALIDVSGGKEQAGALIRAESSRLDLLKQLDRMGTFPSPIGTQDTAGKPVDLTRYRGKALLIVFWSSKIEGTAKVLAKVNAAYKALHKRGLEVLGVNLDAEQKTMDAALKKHGITWRQCFGGRGLASKVARAWHVRSLPEGVLLDHTGRIRYLRPWEGNLQLAVADILARKDKRPD